MIAWLALGAVALAAEIGDYAKVLYPQGVPAGRSFRLRQAYRDADLGLTFVYSSLENPKGAPSAAISVIDARSAEPRVLARLDLTGDRALDNCVKTPTDRGFFASFEVAPKASFVLFACRWGNARVYRWTGTKLIPAIAENRLADKPGSRAEVLFAPGETPWLFFRKLPSAIAQEEVHAWTYRPSYGKGSAFESVSGMLARSKYRASQGSLQRLARLSP